MAFLPSPRLGNREPDMFQNISCHRRVVIFNACFFSKETL